MKLSGKGWAILFNLCILSIFLWAITQLEFFAVATILIIIVLECFIVTENFGS